MALKVYPWSAELRMAMREQQPGAVSEGSHCHNLQAERGRLQFAVEVAEHGSGRKV